MLLWDIVQVKMSKAKGRKGKETKKEENVVLGPQVWTIMDADGC